MTTQTVSVQRFSSRSDPFEFDDGEESNVVSTTSTAVAQQPKQFKVCAKCLLLMSD